MNMDRYEIKFVLERMPEPLTFLAIIAPSIDSIKLYGDVFVDMLRRSVWDKEQKEYVEEPLIIAAYLMYLVETIGVRGMIELVLEQMPDE